ncbi:MAG: hypothetical protein IKW54_02375 [Bacteroidales bacterium]|nr:hypothetical protein [Bacteroidales bacterium]
MIDNSFIIPSLHIGRVNSMNLLKFIASAAGVGCSLTIFSYSITDGWMRQLMNLRHQFKISKIIMVLDRDVIIRHREKLNQLQFIADELYLTDSHAKVYICSSDNYKIAVITSANATQNYRNEGYYITDRPEEVNTIEADVRDILGESSRII